MASIGDEKMIGVFEELGKQEDMFAELFYEFHKDDMQIEDILAVMKGE